MVLRRAWEQAAGEALAARARPLRVQRGVLEIEVDGVPLFDTVQATWNLLERSAGPALAQAHAALKPGGFFGAILPTTNQVSHLLNDLRQSGFAGLEMEELILRPYKAVPARLRPMDRIIAHTGYLVFARKVLDGDGEDWLATKRGRSRAAERGDQDDYW